MILLAGRVLVATTAAALVAASWFVASDSNNQPASLADDGRIGKVTDVQGAVAVKPVMSERFTPVCGNIILKPGDWLQTDPRGANAFAARLGENSQLVAGPGTLVELTDAKQIRLFSGDIKITVEKNAPLKLLGPGEEKLEVNETGVYRVEKEKLVRLTEEPKWLKGFEGAEVQESIGSLVADIDGRNEPLTVGYHKVSVEIRDQIARTTVEESFANQTDRRLEGVFFFPLPQDASISGFGMWIGNNLVEADIVEKQRAREIYEEIRRENRDPGLLEWAGGNLFTARVFPIEPHAEKRIRIVYTQVLPLVGNSFRYSYALQSEMLKKHPLRELSIDVKLSSALPLKNVTSPTHIVRTDRTENSAHVEYAAKQYTPNRDFEVVAELDGKQSEITLIPHRRGEDGYFLLMLAPQFREGEASAESHDGRDLLVGKEPLDLLLLADTSASMDQLQRTRQAEFIDAVLKSLTPRDRFNLACMDVECDFAFEKSLPADAKNIETARQFLDHRVSLGWTDLEKAFSHAFERVDPNTRILYLGDGIPTVGEGDPAAVSARLINLFNEKCRDKNVVCYSVSLGSTFESGVLKSIASLGGGSMHQITGEQGPRSVTLGLLKEITRPALSNLQVQFSGLRVARVYPEQLPNLPAGSQQILLGRYLPEKSDQSGEVLVSGRLGGKEVQFKKSVSLKNAEEGNSFIPRLWARMHLDHLLQQGTSPAIKDDIIALSEEYHIITPYTSLLVLESDADRERFKVKRGFQIRDGEKFFAEGRDRANFELVQEQMKRAGGWRLGLRREVLDKLIGLGRQASLIPRDRVYPVADMVIPVSDTSLAFRRDASFSNALSGRNSSVKCIQKSRSHADFNSEIDLITKGIKPDVWELDVPEKKYPTFSFVTQSKTVSMGRATQSLMMMVNPRIRIQEEEEAKLGIAGYSEEGSVLSKLGCSTVRGFEVPKGHGMGRPGRLMLDVRSPKACEVSLCECEPALENRFNRKAWRSDNVIDQLFGELPPAQKVGKTPEVKNDWPEEVRTISKNLLRTAQFHLADGGLKIETEIVFFDPRFGNLTEKSTSEFLTNETSWLVRSAYEDDQTTVEWCDGRERGIIQHAFQLGHSRKSVAGDLKSPPWDDAGFQLQSLEEYFVNQKVSVAHPAADQILLIFTVPADKKSENRVLVDTKRNVVLSIEFLTEGKRVESHQFGDFVEVAGAWWSGKIESRDEKGRIKSIIKQTVIQVNREKFIQTLDNELAGREKIQFLRDPLRKLLEAKKALKEGKADFDDQIALAMHFAESKQWAQVLTHLDAAEKLAPGKTGLHWLLYALLQSARRNEELKNYFQNEAAELADEKNSAISLGDKLYLANYLLEQTSNVFEANEILSLIDALEPVFVRQPEYRLAMKQWKQYRAECLSDCRRAEESLLLYKNLAETYPHDISTQIKYLQALAGLKEFAAVRKWVDRLLASDTPWEPAESDQLRDEYVRTLKFQERHAELLAYLARWLELNPENNEPYSQYLDALMTNGRTEEAYALLEKWLNEGRRADASQVAVARLEAAVKWMNGEAAWIDYDSKTADKLIPAKLSDTAIFFARHEKLYYLTEWIMRNWDFQRTEAFDKTWAQLAKILAENFDRMSVAEIMHFVGWLHEREKSFDKKAWKDYARRLYERAKAESDLERKYETLEAARNIVSVCAEPEEYLDFLRQLIAGSPESYRKEMVQLLFRGLLKQPWSEKHEDEAFALLDKLEIGVTEADRLHERINSLHELTDHMLQLRIKAMEEAIEHDKKLTRTEMATKKAEIAQKVRAAFADRLAREEQKHEAALAAWIVAERIYLDVKIDRHLEQAAEICWKTLDAKQPQIDEESDRTACILADLDCALRNRYLVTLMNLAARKNAPSELVRRLLDYLDRNIAKEFTDPSENQRWKLLKYNLLIALDRPQELEKALGEWIHAGDADNRWRTSLGCILAEQGKLKEAIAIYEAVAADDELDSDQYRALADWQQAEGRRADCEKSKLKTFETMQSWKLDEFLDAAVQPWTAPESQLPSELSPEVVWAFQAALEKSSDPSRCISEKLLPLYRACRDFRLLACLADSAPGHTAGKIYPFLQAVRTVIDDIHDEAAVDSLSERIAKLREKSATDVDRRALDLLEAMTERRAAELKNQPGPHDERAIAALQRASKHAWSPGEERLMAEFLADLGVIPQEKLAAEQLRQLQTFYAASKPNSPERLDFACAWAKALFNYHRRQMALDLLAAEIGQYATAIETSNQGRAGEAVGKSDSERGYRKSLCEQPIFRDYVSYLVQSAQYDDAVKVLQAQFGLETKEQNQYDIAVRIFDVHLDALRGKGQVAGLQGESLYRSLRDKILAKLPTGDAEFDARLITLLSSVYQAAHDLKIAAAPADLKSFAFGRLQPLIRCQDKQYEKLVKDLRERVYDLCGPAEGIAFLLECYDRQSPSSHGRFYYWNDHQERLTAWRKEAKVLDPKLSDRLLQLVLASLRRKLADHDTREMPICDKSSPDVFWADHEADFLRVAEKVYAQNKSSHQVVVDVAKYLAEDLDRYARAIEILQAAEAEKILDDNEQIKLVDYLQHQKRYGESIGLLQSLIERDPRHADYRAALIAAYFHTNRRADLLDFLQKTEDRFRKQGDWNESMIASLAESCLQEFPASDLQRELSARALKYYEVLIPLHERENPRRGDADEDLSCYYANRAKCYENLNDTLSAVEAAFSAVVCWGSDFNNRAAALETLRKVLCGCEDLEAYADVLDKQSEKTGLQNPLLRKMLGLIFLERGQYDKAVVQLQLACELQPNDAEIYQGLVDCFDKQGDKQGAIRQLIASVQFSRRDINLYKELGRRLADLHEEREAERAYASIVEMLAAEAESHAMLAEIRESQNRWSDAISQWRQVVRLQALEPTGLLRLAAAQVHDKQWAAAMETVRQLRAKSWPPRFDKTESQIQELEKQIMQRK